MTRDEAAARVLYLVAAMVPLVILLVEILRARALTSRAALARVTAPPPMLPLVGTDPADVEPEEVTSPTSWAA